MSKGLENSLNNRLAQLLDLQGMFCMYIIITINQLNYFVVSLF